MNLKEFFIMLVLGSLIIFTFGLSYAGLHNQYGFNVSSGSMDELSKLNTLNKTYALSEEMKGNLTSGTSITDIDSLTGFLKGGYSTLKLVTGSFKIVSDMGQSVTTILGIPVEFYYALMAIIFIFIVFAILSYMFQYNEGG